MNRFLFSEPIEMFPKPIEGIVEKTSPLRVQCLASYWKAQLYESNCQTEIIAGAPVMVVGRQGITMLIVPA